MGKAKSKDRDGIGFRASRKEGKFLAKLLKTGKVSAGITPGALKELYPQFNKFKNDSFSAGLRRMKTKYGCNVRGHTGKSVWFGAIDRCAASCYYSHTLFHLH